MCIHWGHMCINTKCAFILNVKFLCLPLWLGGLYTDDKDEPGQCTTDKGRMYQAIWLHKTNEPKIDKQLLHKNA